LALYYYSNGRPAEEIMGKEHSTLFQARPGEDIKEKSSGMTVNDFLKKLVPPILIDMRDSLKKR